MVRETVLVEYVLFPIALSPINIFRRRSGEPAPYGYMRLKHLFAIEKKREMEVEKYLDMCEHRCYETPKRCVAEPVEAGGVLWDPETGCKVGNVFVSGFVQFRKRTFSRYSRRARFMTEVMNWFTNNTYIKRILLLFDEVLVKWKSARPALSRVYFLNVRCVLFLICERLHIPIPYPKTECLRDVKRFERQKTMFEEFV